MTTEEQIDNFIAGQPDPKRGELEALHRLILDSAIGCRLWFSDGRNGEGKAIANPTVGYGSYTIHYADGATKESFRVGLSANKTGVSVYVLGLADKGHLPRTVGGRIGKASVTGYCIRFKSIQDIDLEVLVEAIRYGMTADQEARG